jgi:hypothetical protein
VRAADAVSAQAVPALAQLLSRSAIGEAGVPALGVLCALAIIPKLRQEAFVSPGGVESFAAALRAAGAAAPPRLAAAAAAAARELAGAPATGTRLADAGGAAAISALMAACEMQPQVAKDGCVALRFLSCTSAECRDGMAAAGAVAAAIAALRAHTADADVVAAACKTLAAFSECVGNNAAAVARGGIEAAIAAQQAHATSPSGVTEHACIALYAFTFHSGGVVQALEKASAAAGGREALLLAISAATVGGAARDQCASAIAIMQQTAAAFRPANEDE